jgi:hypothetical protein
MKARGLSFNFLFMSIPQNKTELLNEINFSYNKLKGELENISENLATQKSME